MFLVDLLFPRCCLGCGKSGCYLCPDCLRKVKTLEKQICPVCEKPTFNGQTHPRCQTKESLDGLLSLFPYEGMIKTAVGKLKYQLVADLAQELADFSIQVIELDEKEQLKLLKWLFLRDKTILVPIPLFWRRKNWRGFNQAELLGGKITKHFGWEARTDILTRQKFTHPQVGLAGKERQQNMQGAFKINPNYKLLILNSKLVLFDDVWTTGSTLKEAGKVLKKAGAKEVWGLTICR